MLRPPEFRGAPATVFYTGGILKHSWTLRCSFNLGGLHRHNLQSLQGMGLKEMPHRVATSSKHLWFEVHRTSMPEFKQAARCCRWAPGRSPFHRRASVNIWPLYYPQTIRPNLPRGPGLVKQARLDVITLHYLHVILTSQLSPHLRLVGRKSRSRASCLGTKFSFPSDCLSSTENSTPKIGVTLKIFLSCRASKTCRQAETEAVGSSSGAKDPQVVNLGIHLGRQ